jgi:hypothetical protein
MQLDHEPPMIVRLGASESTVKFWGTADYEIMKSHQLSAISHQL